MKPANAVTIGLGSLAGLFALILAWQLSGVGMGIDPAEPSLETAEPLPVAPGVAEVERLASLKEYDLILERPLFNEDRARWVPPPVVPVEGPEGNGKKDIPDVKLDVRLTGVIISPDLKIALLADNTTKQSMSVREGMPLTGPLAAWEVATISPREVAFRSSQNNEEAIVELDVDASSLGGNRVRAQQAARAAADVSDNASGDDANGREDAESRAEELRRKVAERRAQLRAEAQRRADDNNN